MKIQLDTNAMNALFPEGSEARVELQAAVIANFATRIRDNQMENMVYSEICKSFGVSDLREVANNAVNKVYLENFTNVAGNPAQNQYVQRLAPGTHISNAINKAVGDIASQHRANIINAGVTEATERLNASLVSALDKLTKHVDDQFLRIESKARELTKRRMDEIIAIELDNRINAAKAGKSFVSSDQ